MSRCTYCKNQSTRNRFGDELCEIHYSYLGRDAKVNPIEIGRCMRCGQRSLDRSGRKERLINHHVNYPLDLTVPICDGCHSEIHSDDSEARYLERYERTNSPYDPIGTDNELGLAIHEDYKSDEGHPNNDPCPDCGTVLMVAPDEMDFESPFICPDGDCPTVKLDHKDLI